LVASIAFRCNKNRNSFFDFHIPFAEGNLLAYPIFPNFHAAFLHASCLATLQNSLRFTAYQIGISVVFLIYKLVLTFTGSSVYSFLAYPLWYFSGGLGFSYFLKNKFQLYPHSCNFIHDFAPKINGFWFQTISHVFHPQRSATFAIPLCLVCLICLYEGIKEFELRFFILAAFYVGIMPQTQVHAYASMAIFSVSLAIFFNFF
jgi:hypothetical protein